MATLGQECDALYDRFKILEKQAEGFAYFPDGAYPCIRMDGVKHSKYFLKDVHSNSGYSDSARKSVFGLYGSMKTAFNRDINFNIVCMLSFSDEVSVVLTSDMRSQRYDRRVMKICTSFCGNLSSLFTSYVREDAKDILTREKPKNSAGRWYPQILAYDARPLSLKNAEEIALYLRHRYLLAKRHACRKALRLAGAPEALDGQIKDDLDALQKLVARYGLHSEYEESISSFLLYLPNEIGELKIFRPVPEAIVEVGRLTDQISTVIRAMGECR